MLKWCARITCDRRVDITNCARPTTKSIHEYDRLHLGVLGNWKFTLSYKWRHWSDFRPRILVVPISAAALLLPLKCQRRTVNTRRIVATCPTNLLDGLQTARRFDTRSRPVVTFDCGQVEKRKNYHDSTTLGDQFWIMARITTTIRRWR